MNSRFKNDKLPLLKLLPSYSQLRAKDLKANRLFRP